MVFVPKTSEFNPAGLSYNKNDGNNKLVAKIYFDTAKSKLRTELDKKPLRELITHYGLMLQKGASVKLHIVGRADSRDYPDKAEDGIRIDGNYKLGLERASTVKAFLDYGDASLVGLRKQATASKKGKYISETSSTGRKWAATKLLNDRRVDVYACYKYPLPVLKGRIMHRLWEEVNETGGKESHDPIRPGEDDPWVQFISDRILEYRRKIMNRLDDPPGEEIVLDRKREKIKPSSRVNSIDIHQYITFQWKKQTIGVMQDKIVTEVYYRWADPNPTVVVNSRTTVRNKWVEGSKGRHIRRKYTEPKVVKKFRRKEVDSRPFFNPILLDQ